MPLVTKGALHLDDVLARRMRDLDRERRAAVSKVAEAGCCAHGRAELGWDDDRVTAKRLIDGRRRIDAELSGQRRAR